MHQIGIDLSNPDARFAWRSGPEKANGIYFASSSKEKIESILQRIISDTGKTVAFVIGENTEFEKQLETLTLVKFAGDKNERIAQIRKDGELRLNDPLGSLMIDYAGALGALLYGR